MQLPTDPRWYDARMLNAAGDLMHGAGAANVGLSSRVFAEGRGVGVVIGLDGPVERLELHVVWLPIGQNSRTAAQRAIAGYQRGELDAEIVPTAGLVSIDAWIPEKPAGGTPIAS